MNRNQFNNKYTAFNINAAEMERKWALYLREQEEIELLQRLTIQSQSITDGLPSPTTEGEYMDDDYIIDQQNYIL